ncbi:MAG: AAA family ATPase, partial [Desulfobacterales bacterium]|nr:AAA family ATPase [Desulfobacterales bacterium]
VALSGLMAAVNTKRGGFSEILWKGIEEGQISFFVTGEVASNKDESPTTYDYEISLVGSARTGAGAFVIEKETLKGCDEGGEYVLADFRNGQGKGLQKDGSVAFEAAEPSNKSFLEYSIPGWEGMVIKDSISLSRFYRLIPFAMRQSNIVSEQLFLTEHGDNLSAWLLTLQTRHRDEYRRLEQAIQDVLPDIKEVLTPPTQTGTTYVLMREKHLKRPISLWRMSDGALQFLSLLSLIFAPAELGAPLFCIEEPENHLHPRMLESLVELQLQRQHEFGSEAAQVVVTTHSPHLVDMVTLEDLVVVEKEKGATHCVRPASKKHLRDLLEREELGLGDLWYSGALGGN